MSISDTMNSTGGSTREGIIWSNDTDSAIYQAANTVRSVYIWVLVLCGVPGNLAAIATILRMPVTTATFYVALLSSVDVWTLMLKLGFHQMHTYRVYPNRGLACRLLNLVLETSSCYASWLLVLVCFERFISVHFPLKKRVYFTKKRAYISAAVLGGLILIAFFHYVFVSGYYDCSEPADIDRVHESVWLWVHACLYFFLPFLGVAALAANIVVSLYRSKHARQTMNVHNRSQDIGGTERAISVMLASAAIVFLILSLPTCVYYLADDETKAAWGITTKAKKYLFFQVTTILADATHAVDFYMYFLSAARFRSKFIELYFTSCRGCAWKCEGCFVRSTTASTPTSGNSNETAVTPRL